MTMIMVAIQVMPAIASHFGVRFGFEAMIATQADQHHEGLTQQQCSTKNGAGGEECCHGSQPLEPGDEMDCSLRANVTILQSDQSTPWFRRQFPVTEKTRLF
jgi:hypothetical protein